MIHVCCGIVSCPSTFAVHVCVVTDVSESLAWLIIVAHSVFMNV